MAGKRFSQEVMNDAQQLDLENVAAMTTRVSSILLKYEKEQKIQHQRHCKPTSDGVAPGKDDCYLWERSIYDGSQIPVWHCLREDDIERVPFSFRFGASECPGERRPQRAGASSGESPPGTILAQT